ncbi:MAG: 23S rRNA (uracil(1939)-C(5))-methyltransferase RlmD [Verrucomicrobia bacterium]|nr:23S rRNA (uracil(1939)-C(5))-methyltransferase RlmD [Deltaproteobacteria bacterium]
MNDVLTTIDKLAFGGNGVCRINGKVCFVPFGCPGDEVRLAITSEKRSYLVARIVELISPSPLRTTPPCPLFGRCGGCSWQHISYAQQLAAKQLVLAETLWRGARVGAEYVTAALPSALQYGYRSRVQFKLHTAGSKLQIGFYRTGSHIVEDVGQGCPVALPVINQALGRFRQVLEAFPDTRSIPKISIDCAEQGVIAVVTYTGRDSASVAAFFKKHYEELLPLTGLFLQSDRKTALQKVYGDDVLTYSLPAVSPDTEPCLLSYQSGGFAQVNREQNSAMLGIVRRLADFHGTEQVLDLYCGNGNFSLPIAGQVSRVTGIEEYAGSIAAAHDNCIKNGITNAEFICADSAGGTRRLADGGRRFDTIILDPPRAGAAEAVPEICRLNPAKIIYISCDPSTLARDCGLLAASGYCVKECVPVDMFPQTYHIESVTLLQKQ